ncbi:hypothetical protein BJ085DRAFT_19381 [Dimargaris cristalligena]|uniref:Fe2OG dioxygenase domain-containing protein n=1 Tax=Dimargaris cristalligena TaxID=215637 RepID=A0A4P9ZRE3_9FUNG|nr:hypothetical protein BJ085DRAFT_19381 [Dimargaris cristalligena]|eukprot:RKP36096.1 hypothetical protein BJ085DRAFT_19381 [Dimargaris cristalligena]
MPVQTIPEIPGLSMYPEFIGPDEQTALMATLDGLPWSGLGVGPNPELKRRTQQRGCTFSFRYRKAITSTEPLPGWARDLVARLAPLTTMKDALNSIIINEYQPGQGIMPHVDSLTAFGDTVFALSLLSPCVMTFDRVGSTDSYPIVLEPRSLLVLTGPARFGFRHGISKDLVETLGDRTIHRERRVSLTFRYIIPGPCKEEAACK